MSEDTHRFNWRTLDDGRREFCRGLHDKSAPCEWEAESFRDAAWFAERPHPEKDGYLQVTAHATREEAEAQCKAWRAERDVAGIKYWQRPDLIQASVGGAAMPVCDQCGWKPSPEWKSERCGSLPFGSCDGTVKSPAGASGAGGAATPLYLRAATTDGGCQQPAKGVPFVRYEMVRIAEPVGGAPARFRIYGIVPEGYRVELDTLYLRDVPVVPAGAGEAERLLEDWRSQDEALQRIWGALGIDGVPGNPAASGVAEAVEKVLAELEQALAEKDAALGRVQAELAALRGEVQP